MHHLSSPSSKIVEAGSEAVNPKGAGPRHPWDKESSELLGVWALQPPIPDRKTNPTLLFPNARVHPGSDLSFGVRRGEGTEPF